MPIQWFPGHMASARRKALEALAQTDVVVELVDARLPEASRNPMIETLRLSRNRPCLRVLNKADLADAEVTAQWLAHYAAQPGVRALALSCRNAGDVARIPAAAQQLAPHRNDTIKPLRLMVMGIPNVGKSTLINALLRRRAAAVGDEPAITKQVARYDLSPRLVLLDTPGLMWPKIEHDADGYMLAASHAIGRNAVAEEEVAVFLGQVLLERYADRLAARYMIEVSGLDGVGLIEAIARRRGCMRKGLGPDLEKAALILLQDYREGRLGKVSLESPASRQEMLAKAAAIAPVGEEEEAQRPDQS